MANSLSILTDCFQHHLSGVGIQLSEEFGAKFIDHRERLRAAMLERLQDTGIHDSPPVIKKGYVSISHCNTAGGFVWADHSVGFDIEESKRVTDATAKRISNEFDSLDFSHPSFLWTAKESAFKAMGFLQPKVLSDISILEWRLIDKNIYYFRSQVGNGLSIMIFPWTAAIFILSQN